MISFQENILHIFDILHSRLQSCRTKLVTKIVEIAIFSNISKLTDRSEPLLKTVLCKHCIATTNTSKPKTVEAENKHH